jgi:GNAT superfamily N-acetyltransferase
MVAVADDAVTELSIARLCADAGRRWQSADRLLPLPSVPPPGCGARFGIAGPDAQLMAVGSCEHWEGEAGSLELTWGAARRFQLTARAGGVDGADVTNALDELLARWGEHLKNVPAAHDADTAAVVAWPSRDVEAASALLRRGFAPLAVVAARITDRDENRGGAEAVPAGVRIRRAGPADIDAVVRLGLVVVRYDANFGGVVERPSTTQALEREAAILLTGPQPWVWLAERGGVPVGMVAAERPERASWIAPMTYSQSVSYLLLAGVDPAERGQGIGAALATRLDAEVAAAGVPLTLLIYAQLNPLSGPFWSRQGYRPLWTYWEARPASAVRAP